MHDRFFNWTLPAVVVVTVVTLSVMISMLWPNAPSNATLNERIENVNKRITKTNEQIDSLDAASDTGSATDVGHRLTCELADGVWADGTCLLP